jgi:putative membrane protein
MSPEEERPPLVDPRVRLAAERTMLAWIRTGLALMGFGFVVARFGLFLREMAELGKEQSSGGLSLWFGVGLVLLGVVVNIVAAFEHVRLLRKLERGDPDPVPRWSLGVFVLLLLAVMGLGMAAYLLIASTGRGSPAT